MIKRFAISGDLHMSAKNLEEKAYKWGRVVDNMIAEGASHIIICGDSMDHHNVLGYKSGNVGDVYEALMSPLLKEKGITVDILEGNHDQGHGEGRAATYPLTRENIFVHTEPVHYLKMSGKHPLHLLPWMSKDQEAARKFLGEIEGGFLFAHLEISGAKMHEGFMKVGGDFAFNQSEIASLKCERIYCGHIHSRQSFASGKIQYVGHPFQNSFKDAGNPQGFLLLTLHDDGTFEEKYIDIDFPCYYTFTGEEYFAAWKMGILKDSDIIKIRDTQLPTLPGEMLPIELPPNVRFDAVPTEVQVQLRTDMSISDSPVVLLEKWAEVNGIEYEKDPVENLLSETLRQIQFEDPALGSLVRVQSITIEGMGSYRDRVTIDWPDGIIGLTGPNGCGKSTCCEAIMAALYGNFPSKTSIFNQVNTKKTEGYLGLRFIAGDIEYLAERTVTRDNQKVCLSRFEGDKKKVIANKVREFKAEISRIVGDEKLFLASCMASQNRVNSFLLAERTERKELLSKLLGFQNLALIKKQVSEDYDKKFADLKGYRSRFEEITFDDPAGIEQQLQTAKKSLEDLQNRRKETDAAIQKLIEQKARLQSEIDRNTQTQTEAASLQARITKIERQIQEDQEMLDCYDEKVIEHKEAIEKAEKAIAEVIQKMKLVEEDIKDEAAELNAALVDVKEQRDSLTKKAEEKAAMEKKALKLEVTITELQNKISARDSEHRRESNRLAEQILKAKKDTALLDKVGCAPNFLDCALIKKAVDEKAGIPALEEELESLELQIMEAEYSEDDMLALKQIEIEADDLKEAISKLETELTFFNQLDAEVKSKQDRINLLQSKAHNDKVLGPIEKEIEGLGRQRAECESSIKDAQSKRAYYTSRIEDAQKVLPEEQKRLAELKIIDMDKLQQQWRDAKEKEDKLRALSATLAQESGDISIRLGQLEKELQYNSEKKQEKNDYAEKIEVLAAQEKHYAVLIKAFDKNGIPQLLIDSCIPQVRLIMRDLLSDFEDAFTIRLETQKVTDSGDKVQEVLDIIVSDSEGERDIRDYSGGEKGIIDLVFRIAFARLQAQRTGARIQIFAADEPFDALDSENSQRVLMVLQKMISAGINQVFIVSHSDEIIQNVPILYRLRKENGTTGVERLW